MISKLCSKCDEQGEYSPNKKSADGLASWCKKCVSRYSRERRAKYPEKVSAENRKWRSDNKVKLDEYEHHRRPPRSKTAIEHHLWELKISRLLERALNPKDYRHKARKNQRDWRSSNIERNLLNTVTWKSRNPHKAREYTKRWRDKNPGAAVATSANRRARTLSAPGTHSARDIAKQLATQKSMCFYCGCPLDKGYQVDHMTPLSRGGSNGPENIVCSCAKCNLRKHNKTTTEFLNYLRLVG